MQASKWAKGHSIKIKSVAGYGEQVVQLAVSADAQSCALRLRKSTRHRRIVLVSWNDVEEPLAMTLPAACLALSPDGRHLAVGTGRVTRSTYSRVSPGNVKIHDAKTGRVVREFGDKHGAVLALAFTRDGRYVVSGHSDSSVRVWSANSGESVATCRGHSGSVLGLAAVADNDQIVSCGEDSTVRLWRLSTGEQVRIFRGHQATVTGIAASKTGSTLASVSEDQSVRLWDSMQRQSSLLVATTPMRQCLGVAFNANDEMLGLVTHRGMMRLIDVRDNKEAYSFAARGRSIVFGENGTFYTLGGDVIAAWKTRSREPIFEKAAPARKHGSRIARSSDGRYIAAGTVDGIVIRKASNGDVVRTLETDGQQKSPIYGIALSPDGKLVAYVISLSYATCEVHVVDHANGERVRIWKQRQHCIWDLKFSPDGNLLAGAGGRSLGRDPGRVMVWNVGTGKLVHELKDHRYGAWSVAFHPDGRRLASGAGGYDRAAPARMGGEIKIWDLRFGQELLTLRDHTSAIMSLEFSNDGTMLASGSADRTARIWMTHSAPTAKRTP